MKPDIIVEEIRNVRRDIFKKCGNNLDAFYKKIKKDSFKFKESIKIIKKEKVKD